MAETDVPEPDYDSMSPSDRAFALFTAVEKARSAAIAEMRDKGQEKDYSAHKEAHQAALAVWNQWAQPLLEEREELEKTGQWLAKNELSREFSAHIEVGQNPETQEFLRRADINARSITFIRADWQEEEKGDGEDKSIATGTEPPFKIISCETISLTGFSFPGYADFYGATFKGNASFISAQFKGNASFISATFKGNANFSSATFKGDANFFSATFKGKADFISATVKGDASFFSATFKGKADFFGATVKGNASFISATFKGYANFLSATLKGNAYFISATFKGYASFAQVDLLSHAYFSHSAFSLGSDWTAINAVRAFNMAGVRFETQVPQFTQAHFTESPRVDNVTLPMPRRGDDTLPAPKPETGWVTKQVHSWGWAGGATQDDQDSMRPIQAKLEELKRGKEIGDPPEGETRRKIERDGKCYRYRERPIPKPITGKPIDKDDIAAFRALRRIAKQGEDHETERKAFKGEMRTQRIAGDHGLPYRLFSWAYDLFTDFGGSFLRPFLLWLALSIASAFIYTGAATSPINKTEQATCSHPLTHASLLSARNALLFATAGQRPFVTKSLDCLYGKEPKEDAIQNPTRTGPPPWLGLFGTVQTLLSAILIFFILLALRNRFKI